MLIGIDPNEMREIDIEGIKFKIGNIPYRVMQKIKVMAIPRSENDYISTSDAIILAVKYGVKGHSSNFKDKSGKEVPFKVDKDEHDQELVSDETLEWYSSTRIIEALFNKVMNPNE